jgi:hypothetical protein
MFSDDAASGMTTVTTYFRYVLVVRFLTMIAAVFAFSVHWTRACAVSTLFATVGHIHPPGRS